MKCPSCSARAYVCNEPHGDRGPLIHCSAASLHNFPTTRTLTARIAGKAVTYKVHTRETSPSSSGSRSSRHEREGESDD